MAVTVHEDAGTARAEEVVTAGVPLPRDAGVKDLRELVLVDETGAPVSLQARALSRWGAPADDGGAPLKWVLLDFPATVAGRGTRTFTLRTRGAPAAEDGAAGRNGSRVAAAPIARAGEDGAIRVDTGVLALTFTKESPGPLALVSRAPGKDRDVRGPALSVTLEENGPLRAAVLVRGELAGGFEERRGRRPLRWSMRWRLTRGSSVAGVQLTIENPDRPYERPFNEIGAPVAKRFGRLALELAAEGKIRSPESAETAGPLSIVQEERRYVVRRAGRTVQKGTRAEGWIAAGGTVLGMRQFVENHPKALVARDGLLALEIFPADADPQSLGGARAKTHEVWVRFPHNGAQPEVVAAAAARPLRATVAPEWLRETGALGPISVEDVRRWPSFERTLDRVVAADTAPSDGTIFDERRAQRTTGWLDYGDSFRDAEEDARRFGNAEFDFGWVLLRQYLREPDHDAIWLEQAEAVLRHVMDIDVLHTDDDAPWANHGVRKHDGAEFTGHSRGPDFSHFWIRGMLAYHLVTGDARAREVAVGELGGWIAAREDEERPGWLVHADELRDVGWVLIALSDLWEATGDEAWLSLARRVAETMVVPGVDEAGTLKDAEFLRRKSSFSPWQQAYVADGLGRVCLALRAHGTPSARLEKALRRMLDFLAGPAWIDEPRELHGDLYPRMVAYAIYRDGRKTEGDASMTQALADPMVWGWLLFGEPRYRATAEEALRYTFPDGPRRYFHPSVSTPAKNAAVRTYFGEASRWMQQTSPSPLTAGN